jgi:hypothetical protein
LFRRHLPAALAAAAGALFLALAWTRRLNFDESLALRAGWLDVAGEPSAPAFLMPWTLLAGAVGHLLDDPGAVFRLLRMIAAGGVAVAFASALSAAGVGGLRFAAAAWLAVANAAFATHALEFRYDAAVLILLLVAFRIVAREGSPALLGAVAGVLALHHLKGAYYAAGVAVVLALLSTARRRDLGRFAAGFAGAVAAWAVVLAPLGLLDRWGESLRTFYALAGSERAPVAETLGPVLRRDLAWWLFVLVALAAAASSRHRSARDRRDLAALALAGLGVGFWVVHPHAWAYLAAVPVPFLLVAALRALPGTPRDWRAPAVAAAAGVALQFASGAQPPLSHVARAFSSPMAQEVAMLRELRAELRPDDRVLDPSGVVYFVPPCVEQWYVDSLFVERIAGGDWMRGFAEGVAPHCTLALSTYRLSALPPQARASLREQFAALPSGLAARRDRPLRRELVSLPGDGRVESFW